MITMRYIVQRSKNGYIVRDLATYQSVAKRPTYGAARAEAARLNVAYTQKISA